MTSLEFSLISFLRELDPVEMVLVPQLVNSGYSNIFRSSGLKTSIRILITFGKPLIKNSIVGFIAKYSNKRLERICLHKFFLLVKDSYLNCITNYQSCIQVVAKKTAVQNNRLGSKALRNTPRKTIIRAVRETDNRKMEVQKTMQLVRKVSRT